MNTMTGIALALSCAQAVHGATYIVSPRGDDRNDGSRNHPFRTIQRAADVMQAGDTCLVRNGIYRETVRPASSGQLGNPLTFRNWPDERPRLVGFDQITGWTKSSETVWEAPITWDMGRNNQIFINGEPAQEARWPNRVNDDPLDWEAIPFDKGSDNHAIICNALPDRPDGFWKGATLWIMAGAKWTSWSTIVEDYLASEKKLVFGDPPTQGSIGTNMSPADRRGGVFYLVGHRGALDKPGEWLVDPERKVLMLCVEADQDPNTMTVEAKRRHNAFDLTLRQHVQLVGFDITGATLDLDRAEHCLIQDVKATWISHTRGGNTAYALNEDLGIIISGQHNTIRDSEIAYSAGNGIKLNGRRNAVINCWIHHTDYTGSYDAPIKVWGSEMLISHNTIHDTGRDCIQPSGQGHIIEYNDLFHMGRLAHDLGGSYVCGSDGGGTEFRYNWCHDNLAEGTRMGIYLDNFTSNYVVYRNVVWNIRGCDIRLNKPSLHNLVVNNTMMGEAGNWGRWPTDWMYGCAYVNNAVSGTIKPHPQAAFAGNRFDIPENQLTPDTFMEVHLGTGEGLELPGITGPNPGVGAYEPGDTWKAGHDFDNPPEATYRPTDTPLRNLVKHGSFDWIQWRGKLGPWTPTGAQSAKLQWGGPGGISNSYVKRTTIIGAGLQLDGEEPDGIEQRFDGLKPEQAYEAGAWVLLRDGAGLILECAAPGIKPVACRAEDRQGWQYITTRFVTGEETGEGLLTIRKEGPGTAFVDDVSLVGIVDAIEPRLPGFAPVKPTQSNRDLPPRWVDPLEVPHVDTLPRIDGTVSTAEYPATPIELADTPARQRISGRVPKARATHRNGILYVAVTVPTSQRVAQDGDPVWTRSDGAEVCLALPDRNAQHNTFILHGFPNGTCESSTEAGAPDHAAARLQQAVRYAASVQHDQWTAEWAIPLKAMDIEPAPALELLFNLGVYRRETDQWIQWGGTKAQTWRVERAGRIRLTP